MPVSARYRGHVLYTAGPPVGAGVSLLEALQILGHYDAKAGRHGGDRRRLLASQHRGVEGA